MTLQTYIPAFLAVVFALGICGALLALAMLLGPKRTTPIKESTFECGMDPIGSPRARMSVRFYQVAILFLVFDIEVAFMYPWVVNYRALSHTPTGALSLFGFVEMSIFVAVLVVALSYVWKKKAIGWE